MSSAKPLAYIYNVAPEGSEPQWQEIGDEYRTNSDVVPVIAFSEYEELKQENFNLSLKVEVYEAAIKLLEAVKQENDTLRKQLDEIKWRDI